jgi:hypothetical protein
MEMCQGLQAAPRFGELVPLSWRKSSFFWNVDQIKEKIITFAAANSNIQHFEKD